MAQDTENCWQPFWVSHNLPEHDLKLTNTASDKTWVCYVWFPGSTGGLTVGLLQTLEITDLHPSFSHTFTQAHWQYADVHKPYLLSCLQCMVTVTHYPKSSTSGLQVLWGHFWCLIRHSMLSSQYSSSIIWQSLGCTFMHLCTNWWSLFISL